VGYPDLAIHYGFTGWPVGFPLLLSMLFQVFGYSEVLARPFSIFLGGSVVILTATLAHLLFRNRYITWLSALLVALNPLLVAFSGRIHTQNGALFFLFASLSLLLLSVIRKDSLDFVNPETILGDRRRLSAFLLSIFLAAFSLAIRETYVVYGLAFAYILYKAGFSFNKKAFFLLLLGIIPFILGYSPSLFYNYRNYGSLLASTGFYWHGEGIPLDIHYLFFGNSSSAGLPGGLVFLLCLLLYAFPIILLPFAKKFGGNVKTLLLLLLLPLVPLTFLYGSFPALSAVPRYVLPFIPIASVISAYAIANFRRMKTVFYVIIGALVLLQQLSLFFPLPLSFKVSPYIGSLAMYSPVYNNYTYNSFPDYTNVMVEWVKKNTESEAVIITPSRAYHFYYYGERDPIILYSYLEVASLAPIIESRPVYLVEDHEMVMNPGKIDSFLGSLQGFDLTYELVDRIPLFSPYVGNTQMKIYRIHGEQGST
jgi:4-amino-4-deoxy-L-arabinose transferase-like glycosyltransferase